MKRQKTEILCFIMVNMWYFGVDHLYLLVLHLPLTSKSPQLVRKDYKGVLVRPVSLLAETTAKSTACVKTQQILI